MPFAGGIECDSAPKYLPTISMSLEARQVDDFVQPQDVFDSQFVKTLKKH